MARLPVGPPPAAGWDPPLLGFFAGMALLVCTPTAGPSIEDPAPIEAAGLDAFAAAFTEES